MWVTTGTPPPSPGPLDAIGGLPRVPPHRPPPHATGEPVEAGPPHDRTRVARRGRVFGAAALHRRAQRARRQHTPPPPPPPTAPPLEGSVCGGVGPTPLTPPRAHSPAGCQPDTPRGGRPPRRTPQGSWAGAVAEKLGGRRGGRGGTRLSKKRAWWPGERGKPWGAHQRHSPHNAWGGGLALGSPRRSGGAQQRLQREARRRRLPAPQVASRRWGTTATTRLAVAPHAGPPSSGPRVVIFPGPIEREAPRAAAAAAATGRAPPAAWLAVTRVRRGRRLVTEVPRYIEKRPIQPTERRPEDPCAGCANLLCLVVTVVWQTPATSARALLPWKPNTPAGRGAAVGDRRNWQSTRVGRKKSSFWRSTRAHVARHVVVAETSSVIGGGGRGRRSKSIHPGTIPTGSPSITPCPASRFPTGSSGGLSFENSNMAAPVSRSPASPLSAAGPSPLWGSPNGTRGKHERNAHPSDSTHGGGRRPHHRLCRARVPGRGTAGAEARHGQQPLCCIHFS